MAEGKGRCPSCGGRIIPLIDCSSCGVQTVREELAPVQPAEKCPVCDTLADVVLQCDDCDKIHSFSDIIQKEKKLICPMCEALLEPDAKLCHACGTSFDIETPEETKPRKARPRKKRKIVGEYREEDVQEIMRIPGVGRLRAEVLCKAGYTSLGKLSRASVEELARVRQIGMRTAKSIKEALQMMYVEPEESKRLLEEAIEEELECPVCKTIVSAYDSECPECGAAFERIVPDKAFAEEIERIGEEKSSLSLFDMKLLEHPDDPQLWIGRGSVLRKMGNLEEALKSYEKAIELEPDLKSAWIAKAEILNRLGRLDEAASCYREIVDESATAAGIELGETEEAMVALEELLAEVCPSCGSSIPLGSNICPSCQTEFLPEGEELPLEGIEEEEYEGILERQLRELESEPPREVAKPPGRTNGLGIVNGRGAINGSGLVNGRGRINGTGMINGKGLVNGKGRVNGLINGNGFVNGLSLSHITKRKKKRAWPHYVALGIAFLILAVGLYGIVPGVEKKISPIKIDGEFQDWEGSPLYTEQGSGSNPDTSITTYGFRLDEGYFSYLMGVEGIALADPTGYDSFYLFIDRDNNLDTGYLIRDMGAEYMVETFGGGSKVAGTPIYGYSDTQDRNNFTQWHQIATGRAAVGGNKLEGQFVINGRFELNGDFRLLFCADDYEGGATCSSIKVGSTFGALLITQAEFSPSNVLDFDSTEILQLTLEARGRDVHINSIAFVVTDGQTEPLTDIDIPAGSTITRAISVDTTGLSSGDLIGISVSSVDSNVPYTVRGSGAKAYFQLPPAQPAVDGWFGEWEGKIEADNDTSPVTNPNNDIKETGVIKNLTGQVYFYMSVEGEILQGSFAPQVRFRPEKISELPGQPSPPVRRLNRMGGEDLTIVYIDTNTSDDRNGTYVKGIDFMPDSMLRIKGINGQPTRKEICRWNQTWNCEELEDVAIGDSKIEISANIPDISSEMAVAFISTDWKQRGDSSQTLTRGEGSRGLGGPEPLAPSWPSSWISVVTDADDGIPDPSLEILEVYFNMDASYLYVRIRTESTSAPSITAGTWWIYIDQDGDGTNDWIVVEMSGTGGGEVHGLAWNVALSQWGGTGADWQDTLSDSDDDSAARSTTMIIGLNVYGCIDFAVLRTNIGLIDDDATIAAADSSSEDESLVGKTENSPDPSLPYIVDATSSGQIPEFESILMPFIILLALRTVIIKRRKRHSGY